MWSFESLAVALVLLIFVMAWREGPTNQEKRKGWSRRRRVLDRVALVSTALVVLVVVPLAAVLLLGGLRRPPDANLPFDRELWLASGSASEEHQVARWRMYPGAAARIRPRMTYAEVRAPLGEPTHDERSAAEPGVDLEYVVPCPEPGLGRSAAVIHIGLEGGVVKHFWTRMTGS